VLLAVVAESKKGRLRHLQIPTMNFVGLAAIFHDDAEGNWRGGGGG
jgi:hypothetical protein